MRICSPESWDSFLCWAGLGALLASVAPVRPPSLPCSCPGRLALRGGTANSLTTGCWPESREQEVRGREEKEVGCLSPALTSSAGIATPSLSMPSPGSPPWLHTVADTRASFRSAPKACFLALPWAPHLHLREVCLPPGHLGGIWFPPETLAQPPFTLAAGSSTQNRAWNIVVLSKYF